MKLWFIVLVIFSIIINEFAIAQTTKSGDLFKEISSTISNLPGSSGDKYHLPSSTQMTTWTNTLDLLLSAKYSAASDSVSKLGYRLVNFTDTTTSPSNNYYVLEARDTNHWGTYIYNPNYCRPLVIQSPHSKKDANTGHQGIHVFIETQALFFFLNGTHRCNSSVNSSCTGTTTACSSTSAPFRISDLAHHTSSIFQKSTEVLFTKFSNTHFIQLHGFSKKSTDPYVILSNGTQVTPTPDYMADFKSNLYNEDTSLTFKVAHLDLSWTRLRGFSNTQGRLINSGSDPCNANATQSNGRFFHMEQEKEKLRKNKDTWNKVANALIKTFSCSPSFINPVNQLETYEVYPNPVSDVIRIDFESAGKRKIRLFSLSGNMVMETLKEQKAVALNLGELPCGVYIMKIFSGHQVYHFKLVKE
ncbi:MAG: hypothetical protein CL840_06830 [Crocinitomicaceae bacterium]|nr:hypothetical protein [Crocinitomicaceae bacterium]|tara:strand:- start:16588 stop:17835 length:1248 start_codon:yes stop_codon:yes gene_type:complete